MASQPLLPFANLVIELRRLCQEKLTGTLLITTDKNRMAQIKLSNGEIASLAFQTKLGAEALPLLQQIDRCWFQFLEGSVSVDQQLPPTADILGVLSEPNTATAISQTGLSKEIQNLLKETLAEFIGPVALILYDAPLQQAPHLEWALETLAKEILNPKTAAQFKEKVRQKLRESALQA